MSTKTTNTHVPVVDFSAFIDGTNKKGVAGEILDSFKTIGFVYLVSHGLPEANITSMFEWSRKLFGQPTEVKQLAPHPESGAHHRGYSAPGREKVKQYSEIGEKSDGIQRSAAPETEVMRDMKESFECGREDDDSMPNIWFPDGAFPGFKEACMEFYWACFETEKMILRALALGYNLPEDYFLPFHSKADNQLRLLHYPSIAASLLKDVNSSRIPSHTDFCSLTMLMQDDIGGLEVEDPNQPGGFIAVPPVPGSIVVNAGDFLMRCAPMASYTASYIAFTKFVNADCFCSAGSNDTIKSTVHRVRIPPSLASGNGTDEIPSRYSIPYFCAADLTTVVDCIPGTWSADRPKLYSPISARDYIMERLAANY